MCGAGTGAPGLGACGTRHSLPAAAMQKPPAWEVSPKAGKDHAKSQELSVPPKPQAWVQPKHSCTHTPGEGWYPPNQDGTRVSSSERDGL